MSNLRPLTIPLMLLAAPLAAQPPSAPGSLQGVVTDPAGRSVPGAVVSTAGQRGATRSVKTDVRGAYRLQNLEAGSYTVRVGAPGFAPAERAGVAISAGSFTTLDFPLAVAAAHESVTVNDLSQVQVDSSANTDAIILSGHDLDALSDDPDDLAADLAALAGPGAGPNGGQIYIDGFSGGRLPSKFSIREIRINQNPFSAVYDRIGMGRVEIFTKPGADDFHGEVQTHDGSDIFNARNPFTPTKPTWQRLGLEGEVGGPLGKKTSFFADFEVRKWTENTFVNARILDAGFQVVPLAQAALTPRRDTEENFKLDRQLPKDQTLTLRYTFARTAIDDQGASGVSLPTRIYRSRDGEDTIQVAETGVYGLHTVNETRARFSRQRSRQSGNADLPTTVVLDAFTGGGSPMSLSFTDQGRFDSQNTTSVARGLHFLRWGGRARAVSLEDQDTQDYTGTFTFTSLDAFRVTLQGQQAGWSAARIRATGGGASQFSLAAGNPLASLGQMDVGVFALDDWRVRPNLTLSLGLRYETQTRISDRRDIAPRLGLAWGLGSRGSTPKTVVRVGAGLFYDRVSESLSLDALRRDAVHQQQFLLDAPDFYPLVPSLNQLLGGRVPQAIRILDQRIQAPATVQFGLGVERQLPRSLSVAVNYLHSGGWHNLRSRDLPSPSAALYLYESSGVFRQNQIVATLDAKVNSRASFNASCTLGKAESDTDGAGVFPADSNNLRPEYGRAGFDVRHRVLFNGSFTAPLGLRLSPMLVASSSRPFNITVGRDLNGDTLFTDRPAFATDLSRPSVRQTTFGAFDLAPMPGQTFIPRNYGVGPGLFSLNLRAARSFKLGKEAKGKHDPMELTLTVLGRNVLNHPNLALPIGNLSSPSFGESIGLPGGGGNTAGNRRIELQLRLSF